MPVKAIVEYNDAHGHSPFTRWFLNINAIAAAKVTTALYRLAQGNVSNTKSVGKGVFEYKINFGPGYRIYYAIDGDTLVILLNGGTKQRQNKDIRLAQQFWNDYKKRKKMD